MKIFSPVFCEEIIVKTYLSFLLLEARKNILEMQEIEYAFITNQY